MIATFALPPSFLDRSRRQLKRWGEGLLFLSYPAEGQRERAKLLWLCRLRWGAILAFLLLIAPALHYGLLDSSSAATSLGILGLIGVFNLFTQLLLRPRQSLPRERLVFYQLTFDLASFVGLLAVSGGIANPFVLLVLMNVSLGAVLLSGWSGVAFLGLVHAALFTLQLQYFLTPHEQGYPIPIAITHHLLILIFWLVLRSLGAHLDRAQVWRTETLVASAKQDRLRAIGALAAGFSHEFASPLNTAKLRLERAARSAPGEDLEEARRAIESCAQVVREMNAAQFDPSSFRLSRVNLSALLQDILDSWEEGEEAPLLLRAINPVGETRLSPVNFSQVVLNLLDNSRQAGGPPPLRITLQKNEGIFFFAVQDNGPGFPAAVLSSLGEPFLTTKAAGTGLGLYVSILFAESLGGKLRAENLAAGGAQVSLTWPEEK